ncbi:hypothetical protein GCM10010412_080610 [Nonomuraea recticatena]
METLGGGEVEIGGQVELVVHAEPVRPGLVEVPGDVRLNGVEAHEARLAEPVSPLRRMDTEVVKPAGQEPEGFTVESESAVVDLKNGHALLLLC